MLAYRGLQREIAEGGLAKRFAKGDCEWGWGGGKEMLAYGGLQREIAKGWIGKEMFGSKVLQKERGGGNKWRLANWSLQNKVGKGSLPKWGCQREICKGGVYAYLQSLPFEDVNSTSSAQSCVLYRGPLTL